MANGFYIQCLFVDDQIKYEILEGTRDAAQVQSTYAQWY